MDRIRKFRLVSVRDADLDRTLLQTCPVAWRQLGCCYETGRGVGQDLEKAAILYSQAAVEGDEVAQYNLGQLYFSWKRRKKTWRRQYTGIKESATAGYAFAQNMLGNCFLQWLGHKRKDWGDGC